MVTTRVVRRSSSKLRSPGRRFATDRPRTFLPGVLARSAVIAGVLALGVPGLSHAQAGGTMQVSARVVPAEAAWSGLAESRLAAQSLAAHSSVSGPGLLVVRRSGVVVTRAQVVRRAGEPLLLVTVQHPHN
jgi:hypothetical protein